MAIFLTMPKLGMNMTEGTIVNWLAKEGTAIKRGEILLEIETDKATNEIESPANGILAKVLHKDGETVLCNTVIAVILQEGENMPGSIPSMIGADVAPKSEVSLKAGEINEQDEPLESDLIQSKRIRISPSARKLAKELGLDISTVVSHGSQIKREDVQKAYEQQKGLSKEYRGAVKKKPFEGMRKATGDLMSKSVRATARVALTLTVDAGKMVAEREQIQINEEKISYSVLLAKATAQALSEFPYMNSRLEADEIWELGDINIGIAVHTGKGLYVPVLEKVGQRTVEELHTEFKKLIEKAHSGSLRAEDLAGGTFTITNLGAMQIESFVPVINYPQCAILGVGAILPKPAVEEQRVVVKEQMELTLVFDHRLVDGEPAARFLQRLKEIIESGVVNLRKGDQ